MIVGSVVVGWMPACLQYYLICTDCLIRPNWASFPIKFYTYFAINCLLILKSAINSYIYAARMQEIQVNNILAITHKITRERKKRKSERKNHRISQKIKNINNNYKTVYKIIF